MQSDQFDHGSLMDIKNKIFTLVGNFFITLVEIFHVFDTCGKRGVTLVGSCFITLVVPTHQPYR